MTTDRLPPLKPEQEIHLLQQDFTTIAAMFVDPAHLDAWMMMSSTERAEALTTFTTTSYLQAYTYKANIALNLQVGDLVTVVAQGKLKVVQVTEVHDSPQLDLYASYQYKWVVDKLELSGYQQRQQEEKELKQMLTQVHFSEHRQQLLNTIHASSKNTSSKRFWDKFFKQLPYQKNSD